MSPNANQKTTPWEGAEPRAVRILGLYRDPRFQVRRKLDDATVSRYVSAYKAEAEMPPIKVAVINGQPFVVDGWHRLAALEALGQETVEALVVEATEREARWMAASANLEHGLPLKAREVREVFRAFIRARKHYDPRGRLLSYRDIGTALGKPHTTIRGWMIRDFPRIAAQYSGEDIRVPVGAPEEPRKASPTVAAAEIAVGRALEAYRASSCPMERGEAIAVLQRAVETMTQAGNWDPPDF